MPKWVGYAPGHALGHALWFVTEVFSLLGAKISCFTVIGTEFGNVRLRGRPVDEPG